MTINGYLTQIANRAILRDDDKAGVQRSIATLQSRLIGHFGSQMSTHFVFGSYDRGTMLPRSMDGQSDVDYMIVFAEGGLRPQSYLDRLRRFAEVRYGRSEVAQSHPTVALELNHIRFELVPALQDWWNGTQIPQRSDNYQNWQSTDPRGFNAKLIAANQAHANLIKPLVRILKYWNATAGYPFESFDLEQQVAGHGYTSPWGLLAPNSQQLASYFFQLVDELSVGLFAPQWKRDAVARLQQTVRKARTLERNGNPSAESALARLLPPNALR